MSSLTKCCVCGKCFDSWTYDQINQHINRCLDGGEERSKLVCPICNRSFKTSRSRTTHMKKCGKNFGISPLSVVKLLQDFRTVKSSNKTTKRQMISKYFQPIKDDSFIPHQPKGINEESFQLAKALSLSIKTDPTRKKSTVDEKLPFFCTEDQEIVKSRLERRISSILTDGKSHVEEFTSVRSRLWSHSCQSPFNHLNWSNSPLIGKVICPDSINDSTIQSDINSSKRQYDVTYGTDDSNHNSPMHNVDCIDTTRVYSKDNFAPNYPTIYGDDNVAPNSPTIYGDDNIAPNYPKIYGDINITSKSPTIYGDINITSKSPTIYGDDNIAPNSPTIYGDDNITSNYPTIYGDDYITSKSPTIYGDDYITSKSPTIYGDDNIAPNSPTIYGDDNIAPNSPTIYGDDNIAPNSPTIYGDDNITSNYPTIYGDDYITSNSPRMEDDVITPTICDPDSHGFRGNEIINSSRMSDDDVIVVCSPRMCESQVVTTVYGICDLTTVDGHSQKESNDILITSNEPEFITPNENHFTEILSDFCIKSEEFNFISNTSLQEQGINAVTTITDEKMDQSGPFSFDPLLVTYESGPNLFIDSETKSKHNLTVCQIKSYSPDICDHIVHGDVSNGEDICHDPMESSEIPTEPLWMGCDEDCGLFNFSFEMNSEVPHLLTKSPDIPKTPRSLKILNFQDDCKTPPQNPSKKITPDLSPFTPFPDYSSMRTPELTNCGKNFGLRKMSRKRMVTVLREIYRQTHKYRLGDGAEISALDIDNALDGCLERGTVPEESSFCEEKPCVDDDLESKVISFVKEDDELYSKVLVYETVDIYDFKERLCSADIKCGIARLMNCMDRLGIIFTLKSKRQTGKARFGLSKRGFFRKR